MSPDVMPKKIRSNTRANLKSWQTHKPLRRFKTFARVIILNYVKPYLQVENLRGF